MPAEFRKKPVVIQAARLPYYGEEGWLTIPGELALWCGGFVFGHAPSPALGVAIPTLEGEMRAIPGDWIIRGVAGEFYPCKPRIFVATYDPVAPSVPWSTAVA